MGFQAIENLKGRRFGQLLVLRRARKRDKWHHSFWRVRCDCGNKFIIQKDRLTYCGRECCPTCSRPQHGLTVKYKPEYQCWQSMKSRCLNPDLKGYKYWGGRGIEICPQWQGDGGFIQFITDMGRRPEGRSLDRINVEGNYTPENCRWGTSRQQAKNQRRNYTPEELDELRKKALEQNPDLAGNATEFEVEMATF
jgi:hypothetical protein